MGHRSIFHFAVLVFYLTFAISGMRCTDEASATASAPISVLIDRLRFMYLSIEKSLWRIATNGTMSLEDILENIRYHQFAFISNEFFEHDGEYDPTDSIELKVFDGLSGINELVQHSKAKFQNQSGEYLVELEVIFMAQDILLKLRMHMDSIFEATSEEEFYRHMAEVSLFFVFA